LSSEWFLTLLETTAFAARLRVFTAPAGSFTAAYALPLSAMINASVAVTLA
jgi:hypothetical protein